MSLRGDFIKGLAEFDFNLSKVISSLPTLKEVGLKFMFYEAGDPESSQVHMPYVRKSLENHKMINNLQLDITTIEDYNVKWDLSVIECMEKMTQLESIDLWLQYIITTQKNPFSYVSNTLSKCLGLKNLKLYFEDVSTEKVKKKDILDVIGYLGLFKELESVEITFADSVYTRFRDGEVMLRDIVKVLRKVVPELKKLKKITIHLELDTGDRVVEMYEDELEVEKGYYSLSNLKVLQHLEKVDVRVMNNAFNLSAGNENVVVKRVAGKLEFVHRRGEYARQSWQLTNTKTKY